jgi:hypothetical protein
MDQATMVQERYRYVALLNLMTTKDWRRAREIQLSTTLSPTEKMRLFETELGGGSPLQWQDPDYLKKIGA